MNRTRTITMLLAALAIAAALTAVGCGGDNDNSGGGGAYGGSNGGSSNEGGANPGGAYGGKGDGAAGSEAATTAAGGGGTAVLKVANASGVGAVLVDAEGFTVYDFHKDKGTTSSCYGACAELWPPVTTSGAPKASGGANSSMLGTTKRKDGTMQVTYAGHPLYTFTEDTKPGEANGNDLDFFGGEWYALQASGEEAEG